MRGRTIAYIFETIKNLERELAFLKALVQQSISEDGVEHDSILADAEYFPVETDHEILVDAEIIEDDTKPAAKPTKKEQLIEARRRAQEWAKTLPSNKKRDDSDTIS
jgi:hypothetical protein